MPVQSLTKHTATRLRIASTTTKITATNHASKPPRSKKNHPGPVHMFLQHDHPHVELTQPATSARRHPAPTTDGVGDLYRLSGRSHPATPAGPGDQSDEAHPATDHARRPAAGDAGQGQETFQVHRRRGRGGRAARRRPGRRRARPQKTQAETKLSPHQIRFTHRSPIRE